jgi:hypothetical protein
MAKFFRGDKRRRELDRKRRGEEKQERLRIRREMRARGLDPDTVDADGNPLPLRDDLEGVTPGEQDASAGDAAGAPEGEPGAGDPEKP